MNTTDEGSFSLHKNYKLGPTYPQHTIFSLRELHQASPSALRAETSSRGSFSACNCQAILILKNAVRSTIPVPSIPVCFERNRLYDSWRFGHIWLVSMKILNTHIGNPGLTKTCMRQSSTILPPPPPRKLVLGDRAPLAMINVNRARSI